MTNLLAGVIAGFCATFALSVLMLMKERMHLMPALDLVSMISGMMHTSRPIGWIMHFMVGTIVYGLVYAWLFAPIWAGMYWLIGIVIGVVGWLIASVALLPMAGKGVFGMKIGFMAPIGSLMMHAIFGVILGAIYGALVA